MDKLKYSDLNYEPTVHLNMKWKASISEAQVVKTEVLPPESNSILGLGVFKPECAGRQPTEASPWSDLTMEQAQ